MNITDKEYSKLEKQVCRLLKSLKADIGDEYRATDDPDDNTPGMCVTIGATPTEQGELSWSYQTGDNSYSGGAYGHHNWGVVYLYRRSNCADLAKDCVNEIADSIASYQDCERVNQVETTGEERP